MRYYHNLASRLAAMRMVPDTAAHEMNGLLRTHQNSNPPGKKLRNAQVPSAGWLLLMVSTQARNIQATICHREDSLTKLQCHHRFCVHRQRLLKPEVGWEGGNGDCCRLSLFCPPQWDLFSKLLFSFPWPPMQKNHQTFWASFIITGELMLALLCPCQ